MSETIEHGSLTARVNAVLAGLEKSAQKPYQEDRVMDKLGRLAVLGGVPVADMHFIRPATFSDRMASNITFDMHTRSALTGYDDKTRYTFMDMKISPQTAWLLTDELALTTRERIIKGYLLEGEFSEPNKSGFFDLATAEYFRKLDIGAIALKSVWLPQATQEIVDEVEDSLNNAISQREKQLNYRGQTPNQFTIPGVDS